LQAGLVDRLEVFGAGLALGADARPGLGPLGLTALADAPRFRLVEVRTEGADVWSGWETPQP
jgi:diaminohydroxyphosphoribosylaminopyrimidine deaminase/5-amino-6-(5-phosphoribosylamino)uracil reductase